MKITKSQQFYFIRSKIKKTLNFILIFKILILVFKPRILYGFVRIISNFKFKIYYKVTNLFSGGGGICLISVVDGLN